MSHIRFAAALALAAALAPVAAHADDPRDPAMKDRVLRQKDAAITRGLNAAELERTRARDRGYAAGWAATRAAPDADAEYQRAMAEWRRAVKLCREGYTEYCAR